MPVIRLGERYSCSVEILDIVSFEVFHLNSFTVYTEVI